MKKSVDHNLLFLGEEVDMITLQMKTIEWTYLLNNLDNH